MVILNSQIIKFKIALPVDSLDSIKSTMIIPMMSTSEVDIHPTSIIIVKKRAKATVVIIRDMHHVRS